MTAGEGHGTDPFEHYAGAYVLGALPEREAADFAAHIERCPACALSVAEVAHLPAMLDRVPPADIRRLARERDDEDPAGLAHDLEPPPTLLPALLSRAGVRRPRRRWHSAAALVAAAAAGVLVLAAIEAVEAGMDRAPQAQRPAVTASPPNTPSPSTSPKVTSVVLRPVGRQVMTAAVRLERVAWGTKIELICAYPKTTSQYPAGTAFSLVVTDAFGNRQQVATWSAVAGRTLTVPAATSLKEPILSRVELRQSDGQVLLAGSP